MGQEQSIPQDTAPTRSEYRQDIQGLRGVAVLLVVLYHSGVPLFPAGFVGVDVFFVISGYLITGLLVRELEGTGRVNFAHFYARRVRRLLPAALLVIIAVLGAIPLVYAPMEQGEFLSACRAAAIYLVNFWFADRALDYLGQDSAVNPMLHMWSLAVEEQFYLVWPLLIATVARAVPTRRLRVGLVATVTAVSVVTFLLCIWMTWKSQPWAFFGAPFRTWEFGLGALAFLLGDQAQQLGSWRSPLVGVLGATAVLVSAFLLSQSSLFPGAWALFPAGGTAIIIAAIHAPVSTGSGSPLSLWLAWWPLAKLGDLSYSWYLWHWPVLVFAAVLFPERSATITLAAVILSLALAEASYRFVENPIRFSPTFAGRDSRSVALALVCSFGVAVITTILKYEVSDQEMSLEQRTYAAAKHDLPKIHGTGCHADFDTIDQPECVFGHPDSPMTVVLFGDSHAEQWFPAFERLALKRDWRLMSLTKSGCPSMDVEVFNQKKRRAYFECAQWRNRAIDRIVLEKPALVVLANSSRYGSALDWEAGARRAIQRFAAQGIPVAVIRDTPWPGLDGPTCLARLSWVKRDAESECVFQRSAALAEGVPVWEAEIRSLSAYSRSLPIDLTTEICPVDRCGVARGGQVHFFDLHHLTASYAASLAPAIDKRLLDWASRPESPIRPLIAIR
jgi:peptidoglycan/LPS O-acetylase OafA/YrhL